MRRRCRGDRLRTRRIGTQKSSSTITIGELRPLDGEHLVHRYSFAGVHNHVMIDSGAIGNFCSQASVDRDHLTMDFLQCPSSLEIIDGSPISLITVTHAVKETQTFHRNQERISLHRTDLGDYDLILGILWLAHYDVRITLKGTTWGYHLSPPPRPASPCPNPDTRYCPLQDHHQ